MTTPNADRLDLSRRPDPLLLPAVAHIAHDDAPSTSTTDAADGDALRLLNRSPHPYRRRQSQLHENDPSPDPSSWSSSDFDLDLDLDPADGEREHKHKHKRKRQDRPVRTPLTAPHTPARSLSESGTEADDEAYSFVRALPAPPIRPHKGLRDGRGTGVDGAPSSTESVLLTPSQLDEEGWRLSKRGYFRGRGAGPREEVDDEAPEADGVRRERERFMKRRRAELLRRGCEVALLAAIGALVLRGAQMERRLGIWSRELSSYVVICSVLILLYPLRLLFFPRSRSSPFKHRIRIPAAFDPAPLLYPAALPILVSLSLYPTMERILLPNIVLAIAALPPQLIPSFGHGGGYSMEHWFLSILPLVVSEHTDLFSNINAVKPYLLKAPVDRVDPDIIASLFALHRALLPPLYYLTTTSLLPAELQLLSISLINLLLFSSSPQMKILSAILWIGGLALFLFCGHVLRWAVAIARIPKWRFRRAGRIIGARQSFLEALSQGLRSGSSRSRSAGRAPDSDADEDGLPGQQQDELKLKPVESAPGTMQSLAAANISGTKAAIGAVRDAFLENAGLPMAARRGRRNTLPSHDAAPKSASRLATTSRAKQRRQSYAQSFRALTPTQAAVRKWLYAGYVYLALALVILVPIRTHIAKHALDGIEPFGWAIGYLLGNIREVRFAIVKWNLDTWIALPPLWDAESSPTDAHGLGEHLRHAVFGPANTRLLITTYWLLILVLGMLTVLRLSATVEVDTRRKVFHGMMVAMLLPTTFVDPAFVALTLALVLSVFCLLDLLRASQLPPLSRPLAYFLTPYVDGRDLRGPVVVSHIFLLIGCAIPLWLGLAGAQQQQRWRHGGVWPWAGWDVGQRDESMVAGVVCVGMGDAAASLIGRRFGRRKWPWLGGKSLEGSLAFAAAVTLGLTAAKAWLRLGQWDGGAGAGAGAGTGFRVGVRDVGKAAFAGAAASFMEAVLTGGNDNVVVPIVLWLVVRGVRL